MMAYRRRLIATQLAVGVLAGLACSSPPTKKVLVIGIDGVRPDVLAEVPTPAIDSLIAEGAYSATARTGFPTVSGPGWSSLLIGVWPEKHGVTSNDFTTNRYDRYPDFLTRIEQIRPELNTLVVADWLPLVADKEGGPLFGDAPDVKVVFDGYDLGWAEADEQSVVVAVSHLRDEDPDAAFVYLGNPDETSHETRSIGAPYREAIALADSHVARLVEAVRQRPTYANEDWLILISTDHGRRASGGHGEDSPEERTIFYLASGPSTRHGPIEGEANIVDVAVTALAHLGFAADASWELDGRVLGF
jgi:predicted AlkP superfamily pyrophosphatase or phosphodiesterase